MFKAITDKLSVSGQLKAEDIATAHDAGFGTIINNRPDREAWRQPSSDKLASVAAELNMKYFHIPITPGKITGYQVQQFAKIIAESEKPVLAFCRTGNRSQMLWKAHKKNAE